MRFCREESKVSFLAGDSWLTAFCEPGGVAMSSIFSKLFLVADPWAIFSDISPEGRYLCLTFFKEKTSNLLLLQSFAGFQAIQSRLGVWDLLDVQIIFFLKVLPLPTFPKIPDTANFQGLLLPAKDSVCLCLLSHIFISFCFIVSQNLFLFHLMFSMFLWVVPLKKRSFYYFNGSLIGSENRYVYSVFCLYPEVQKMPGNSFWSLLMLLCFWFHLLKLVSLVASFMEIKNDSQNALVEWIGTGSFFFVFLVSAISWLCGLSQIP